MLFSTIMMCCEDSTICSTIGQFLQSSKLSSHLMLAYLITVWDCLVPPCAPQRVAPLFVPSHGDHFVFGNGLKLLHFVSNQKFRNLKSGFIDVGLSHDTNFYHNSLSLVTWVREALGEGWFKVCKLFSYLIS